MEKGMTRWRKSRLHRADRAGRQRLDRLALARDARDGRARAADRRGRRRRRHLEPDDLPEGDGRGRLVRRAARGGAARPRTTRRRSSSRSRWRTSARRATCMRPVWDGGDGRRRLRLARGRPDARLRPRGDLRAGDAASTRGRPAEPLRQDPGDEARPRRDRGLHREGQVDQRDADLLARALRGGRRGVPPRARAARRGRRRPAQGRAPWRASSSPASTPRPTGGSTRSAARRTSSQGKLAIANAKLAYQHYLETFSGPRWEFLAGKGATPQRCLWASTSTKNPAYRDVMYVEELIGPETVNTMPAETIAAFQDHGEVAATRSRRASTRRAALLERARGGGCRLRRRRRDARGGGRAEVRRLVRRAARRDPRQAGASSHAA